jgi:hypothetical protein
MESKETDLILELKELLPDYSAEVTGTVTFTDENADSSKGIVIALKKGGILVASIWVTTAFPGIEGAYYGKLEAFRSLLPKEIRAKFDVDRQQGEVEGEDGAVVDCQLEACYMALPTTENANVIAAAVRYVLTGRKAEGMRFEKEGSDDP